MYVLPCSAEAVRSELSSPTLISPLQTFAFASWQPDDALYQGWGPLRVINEDRVAKGRGFPPHPHREFEIFSYIVDGVIV